MYVYAYIYIYLFIYLIVHSNIFVYVIRALKDPWWKMVKPALKSNASLEEFMATATSMTESFLSTYEDQ